MPSSPVRLFFSSSSLYLLFEWLFFVELSVSEERAMYLREKASKLYHTSAYFLSKTLLDLPIQFLLTLCYGTIAYLSVGLQLHSELFFRFILVLVLIASCAQSLGLLLAATTPNAFVAMTLCPLCMVPFMLTSGFFLNVDSVPKAFDFLVALSPHRYLFSAALLTEFKNLKFYCDPQEALLAPSPSGPWGKFKTNPLPCLRLRFSATLFSVPI